MSSKIRHYFKSETGKATARGFVAGVASMCIVWPLSLAMTAGAVMPFALGLTGSIGLCSTAAILNHRAEKKAGMPINSLVSKQWRGWVAGRKRYWVGFIRLFPHAHPGQKSCGEAGATVYDRDCTESA